MAVYQIVTEDVLGTPREDIVFSEDRTTTRQIRVGDLERRIAKITVRIQEEQRILTQLEETKQQMEAALVNVDATINDLKTPEEIK